MPGNKPRRPPVFPQNRIQRLLAEGSYNGLGRQVRVEGSFIHLSRNGIPLKQVYIAITDKEMIAVRQGNLLFEDMIADDTDEPDLSGLTVDFVIPLSLLYFSVIDNRSKTFAICTCVGLVQYFEMCQLDSQFEENWIKWRDKLLEISESLFNQYGYKLWMSDRLLEVVSKSPEDSVLTYGKCKPSQFDFVRHSFPFKRVQTVSVQTEMVQISSVPTEPPKKKIFLRNAKEKWPIYFHDRMEMAGHKLGVTLKKTSWKLETRKSSSSDDITTGASPSDVTYHKNSLLQYLHYADNLLYNTSIKVDHPTSLRKIAKADRPNVYPGIWDSSDSEEEEEDDVESAITKYQNKRKAMTRNGRELWSIARSKLLKRGQLDFQKAVEDIFIKCNVGEWRSKIVKNITELSPFEVAEELSYRNRRLLLAVRANEINHYVTDHRRMLPVGIARLLKFNRDLARLVTTETLKGQTAEERATIIKYFQQVCIFLLKSRDFQSVVSILRGLGSFPLARLSKTWDHFEKTYPWYFGNFLKMVKIIYPETDGGYKQYRNRLKLCFKTQEPFIAWFEHFLWHLQKRSVSSCSIKQPRPKKLYVVRKKKKKGMKVLMMCFRCIKPKNMSRRHTTYRDVGSTTAGHVKHYNQYQPYSEIKSKDAGGTKTARDDSGMRLKNEETDNKTKPGHHVRFENDLRTDADVTGGKLDETETTLGKTDLESDEIGLSSDETRSKLAKPESKPAEIGSKIAKTGSKSEADGSMSAKTRTKSPKAGSKSDGKESMVTKAGSQSDEVPSKSDKTASVSDEKGSDSPYTGSRLVGYGSTPVKSGSKSSETVSRPDKSGSKSPQTASKSDNQLSGQQNGQKTKPDAHVRFELPPKQSRRKSLIEGRRKSLFEQAEEERSKNNKQNDHFQKTVDLKFEQLMKRGPLEIEWLDPKEQVSPPPKYSGKTMTIIVSQSDESQVPEPMRTLNKSKSTNPPTDAKGDRSNNGATRDGSNMTNNAKKKETCTAKKQEGCVDDALFSMKPSDPAVGLYDDSPVQQLFAFKLSAGAVDVRSRQTVRESLKLMTAPGKSDYWLLRLSFELE